jgi:hypothetical protein
MSKSTSTTKRDPGRPKNPAGTQRTDWIGAAVTPEEKRAFVRAAEDAGRSIGQHVRISAGISRD